MNTYLNGMFKINTNSIFGRIYTKFCCELEFPSKMISSLLKREKNRKKLIELSFTRIQWSASYSFLSSEIPFWLSTKKHNNNKNTASNKISNLWNWKSRVINEMMMKFITFTSIEAREKKMKLRNWFMSKCFTYRTLRDNNFIRKGITFSH